MHALPNKCDQSKKIQCIHPVLSVSKAGGKHDVGKSISVIKALVNHTETISAPKKSLPYLLSFLVAKPPSCK
jgi:hypothetical protein